MEKKIEDYLHLYIGCPVESPYIGDNQTLAGISKQRQVEGHYDLAPSIEFSVNGRREIRGSWFSAVKPILRTLDSMTIDDLSQWRTDIIITIGPYNVAVEDKNPDGSSFEIYPDGSITERSMDDGDSRAYNGGQLFRVLLSKHFDLFGLIDAGLAINAATKPLITN